MGIQTLVTPEQFDALPYDEEHRVELLDGEILDVPSATAEHNVIQLAIAASLFVHFRQALSRDITLINTDFAIGSDRLQPDVAVLLGEKALRVSRKKLPVQETPDIAVEIVSPSELAHKLERKIAAYLNSGISEVWIVYPDEDIHALIHTRQQIGRVASSEALTSNRLPGWSLVLDTLLA